MGRVRFGDVHEYAIGSRVVRAGIVSPLRVVESNWRFIQSGLAYDEQFLMTGKTRPTRP
jgi:hypothetical protein